jgi:serine/threonine-protein kinase HipA
MSDDRDRVVVHLDARELGPLQPVGALSRERAGSKSVISFAYEPGWVGRSDSFPIDPSLPLFEGEQYPPALPGIFADAAPDRWGRTLLDRREALEARREGRERRRLDEWDFLVGVSDLTRMGALRLARPGDGAFVDNAPLAIPPSARLRELEQWARELEHGLPEALRDEDRWVAMLVAPGSSLGGTRPKASFLDEHGAPWIAKFPSRDDRHDVGAWEHVVSRLAAAAGIEAPETRLLRLGAAHRTFCAKRFDRIGGRRLYASAMTLAGWRDHDDSSYLDIARAIVNFADPAAIEDDLRQLFRRVLFNVVVSNHDDHLRNHGFLRGQGGWRLAPSFDVNPSPHTREHSLALDESLRAPDLDAVRATAPLYRVSAAEADETLADVRRAVARWREEARSAELPGDEIEVMAAAFALAG